MVFPTEPVAIETRDIRHRRIKAWARMAAFILNDPNQDIGTRETTAHRSAGHHQGLRQANIASTGIFSGGSHAITLRLCLRRYRQLTARRA
jgi:hypothetical protein